MPLFQWNDTFSVSVSLFDGQHKELIAIINKLYDAMKEGKGKTVLRDIFRDLISYTVMHFSAEENLMQQHHYPARIEHMEQHRQLTDKVKELQSKFDDGNMFVTIEVLEFLKNWLTGHIMETDKKYSLFFNEKGLK